MTFSHCLNDAWLDHNEELHFHCLKKKKSETVDCWRFEKIRNTQTVKQNTF